MLSLPFQIARPFSPSGDQPSAIASLGSLFKKKKHRNTLLGVTGSGKTFTVANVIQELQSPTLVLAHNKTLASQLFQEFKLLFPNNAVEYFVSYYDYYQPEAYIPSSDTYIEKDARINERIERMRNSATASLLSRSDVVVVSSVSCIYGLGDPGVYQELALHLSLGFSESRMGLIRKLARTQHRRLEVGFQPGSFRMRGSAVEVWPIYEEETFLRLEFKGEEIVAILKVDVVTGEILSECGEVTIYPVGHYVQPEEKISRTVSLIEKELRERLGYLRSNNKELEAERLKRRVENDIEELVEYGYCRGIENYSSLFEGRADGQPPFTLLNYFPDNFLTVIDESHVTLPQVYGMVKGDNSRKKTLIDYGFRLPSALNNRPLAEPEFEGLLDKVIYTTATPTKRELLLSANSVVEQIVRPTGLVDPEIDVRPAANQVEDCLYQIQKIVKRNQRVLVTTLTKRSAEELTDFLHEHSVKAAYMHADIDTLKRSELIRDLRLGVIDVLVGINLLREGLDIPEVSLVLILDADSEGFLRSETSLIQTCGRAARHVDGRVIMYADRETKSIGATIREATRRRLIQLDYNKKHKITPESVEKPISKDLKLFTEDEDFSEDKDKSAVSEKELKHLKEEMFSAASDLNFEKAIELRDQLSRIEAGRSVPNGKVK